MNSAAAPRMVFQKYGRAYQLRMDSHADLAHILGLSESHWMANSAPVDAFACDRVFLDLVDCDRNGRIRCDEVRIAVRWLLDVLRDRQGVDRPSETLSLDAVNTDHPDGNRIHAAARRILTNLRRPEDAEVTLAQVRNTGQILAAADANGDGVIPPSAAKTPEVAQFIQDMIATVGGEAEASGGLGVTEAKLNQFLKEAQDWLEWSERGKPADEAEARRLRPLGEDTAAAFAAFQTARPKVEEYFRLCQTIAYEPAASSAFRPDLKPGAEEGAHDAKMRAAPIMPLAPDGILRLDAPVNPAWRAVFQALRGKVLAPILGPDAQHIGEAEWRRVCDLLAPHAVWRAAEPQTQVGRLGVDKLRAHLDPACRKAVSRLIAADRAAAAEVEGIRLVEKLILYQRWLLEFANNFVNFSDLYDPDRRALFETGTLVMDGRQFTFCVKVDDRAAHAKIAEFSKLFVLYVELTQGATGERRQVAAAVTSGGRGNLYLGKHGIFMDREGRLWDATVVQMIENPISLSQAFLAPFQRIGELIQGQIERFAGSSQKIVEDTVSKQATTVTAGVQQGAMQAAPAAPAPTPASASRTPARASGASGARDLLIGGSVAFAALGSSLAYITKTVKEMQSPRTIATVAAFLIIALLLPMVLNAWVKLRQRDLGALLEASGWAINGRMRITRIMKGIFTRRPKLPSDARKIRFDRLARYAGEAARPYRWARGRVTELAKDISEAI